MRKTLLTMLMILGCVAVAHAQNADQKAPAANAPAQAQQPKTIFDFRKDLGLTDKQAGDIQKLMADLQKTLTDKGQEVSTLRQKLSDLINNKGDMEQIRKALRQVADIQVDNSCLDIETSRKVEAVLTADQLAKWKDIQKKSREAMIAALQAQQAQASATAKPTEATK